MRLTLSLGLWLVAVSSLMLATHGWVQLKDEEADLYAAVGRELTLVATAARSTAENALRDGQAPDVEALLEQLELKDPAVDVFVFAGGTRLLDSSRGSERNATTATSFVLDTPADAGLRVARLPSGMVAALAPFASGGIREGSVVILRPPDGLQADLSDERAAVWTSIALLIALMSLSIWAVVHVRIQRPLEQMVEVVRSVSRGDLSRRVNARGKDELAELAREFDAMVASLEQTRARLSQEAELRERLESDMARANRLAIVGGLAATLAHEVGSPLQVLGGRADDIAQRPDLPPDVTRSAAIIVEQADRVHHIVERLLDVARRKAPQKEPVELTEVAHQVVELLASQARRVGVHLNARVPGGLVVHADRAQVQQVLLNLLQNALRATPKGGQITVHAERSSFRPGSMGASRPSVRLLVEDEGLGVDDALKAKIFEPFYTAWHEKGRTMGTGLGLSVVKSIVTDHEGALDVEDKPSGRGARFVVHLPLDPPDAGSTP